MTDHESQVKKPGIAETVGEIRTLIEEQYNLPGVLRPVYGRLIRERQADLSALIHDPKGRFSEEYRALTPEDQREAMVYRWGSKTI